MVYIAPEKGARNKAGQGKNGNKANRGRGKEREALASKADLLAQLTRQAEEHTRILERERVALGLPGRPAPGEPSQQQPQPSHKQPQGQGQGAPANQRRRNHVYTDQSNKKVFDPRQIPGLGGDDVGGPAACLPGADQILNQTFPDSPNFYPGRVFAIPGTIPPPPDQPQQPRPDGGTIIVSPWGGEPLPQHQPPPPRQAGIGAAGGLGPPPPPPLPAGPPSGASGPQPLSPGARGPPPGAPYGMPPPQGMGMPPIGPHGQRGPPMGPPPMQQQYPQQPFGVRPPSGNYGPPPPLPPPPQQQQQQQQQAYGLPGGGGGGGLPGPISPTGGGGGPGPGHGAAFIPPYISGGGGPGGSDPAAAADPRIAARLEAEARKEAYRRDLEEQIRAKKLAKEAEERRRREEDALWEARAAAGPPWDPEARRGGGGGGGGDPIRDEFGMPVANLRQRRAAAAGSPYGGQMGMPPSPFGAGAPPQGWPAGGPFFGAPSANGPQGRLTIDVPGGGGGGGAFPPSGPLGPLEGPVPGGAPMAGIPGMPPPPGLLLPAVGSGPYDGSPGGNIPPVSPGNRRFLAAMNDLIAGPSDDQRRQKELARQRLQMDLEEQIREKRERQARERAERERERLKEEAEMKAHFDNLNAQRQREVQVAAAAASPTAGGPGGPGSGQQPQQQQQPGSPGAAGSDPGGPRRRGKGRIIDASWLDAPKPAALPPLPPQPLAGPGGAYGRRPSSGMVVEDIEGSPLAAMSPRPGIQGRGPSRDGAAGGRGTVTTLLHQLQEEQSRMREDFARQAAAMEKLANDASRALADRDDAWRELQRVRALLAAPGGLGQPGPGPGGDPPSPVDFAATTVIIDTHLLPVDATSIPDPLPKPVASEVLRRGRSTDPGPLGEDQGGGGGLGPGGGGALGRLGGRGFLSGSGDAAGVYGGGGAFGFDDIEGLQSHLSRNLRPPRGAAAVRGGRRSGIPLPPGMGGPGQRRAPIQAVYGLEYDNPPKSRYNSFFGLDVGKPGHQGGGGGAAVGALPSIGPNRRPPPLKPPASPPILRGDHLPSPVRQTRGQPGAGGARVRSGRPAPVGGLERPPRAPRAASALTQPTPRSPPGGLPPMPAAVRQGVSRRSLEEVQKLLRRGHEERLLAGPAGRGGDDSDDAAGGGHGVQYGTADLTAIARAGRGVLGGGGGHSREPSLPGYSEAMSPGRAADYLSGGGAANGGGNSGRGLPRSFNSDSMASYRSLLSRVSEGVEPGSCGHQAAALSAVPEPRGGSGSGGGGSRASSPGGAARAEGDGQEKGKGSLRREASTAHEAEGEGEAEAGRGSRGGGSDAGGGPHWRSLSSAGGAGLGENGASSDMPVRRPVRVSRRLMPQVSEERSAGVSGGGGADSPR